MAFDTRLTDAMVETYVQAGFWGRDTIYGSLERTASTHPDREALYDGQHRLTYSQLRDRVNRVAATLSEQGIGAGDVVTIQIPNWVEYPCVFFALERIGAVANPVSVDFRTRELEYILRFSESRAFISCSTFKGYDYSAMIRGLLPKLPDLKLVGVVRSGGGEGVISLDGAIHGDDPVRPFAPYRLDANEITRMAFTSGTTGNPKGVIHSQNTTLSTAVILNRDMGFTDEDSFLIYLPLGLNWGFLALVETIILGARAVLLDQFNALKALELIERERVTFIPTAPASIIAMLNENALPGFDLSSLRMVMSGGASCPIEVIREYRAKLQGYFVELYGMLETGFHTYTRTTDDPERVAGSVGTVATGMGVRVIDDQGRDVPRGEVGEIAADGPCVHLGYHKNPAANAELFTEDGWFRTGDLGRFDEQGLLHIAGRLKEIINRGGKKFFPREIEEILYTHPKVLHAAVIGVPDARLGERNCLCLIPREGQSVTLEEMVGFLKDEVATYKLPEQLEIVEAFPFTPTGKLQRHVLAQQVLERRSG
ncbi:MAG: AMP-binding protein [SAR324 cluster bacterium]|nr:AMP-binding protein [SAR324 cluster bacterium]